MRQGKLSSIRVRYTNADGTLESDETVSFEKTGTCPFCGESVPATFNAQWETWSTSTHEATCSRAPWNVNILGNH
jgi:hypothetical protein